MSVMRQSVQVGCLVSPAERRPHRADRSADPGRTGPTRGGRLGSIGRIDPGPERLAGRVTLRAEVDGYLHCTLSTAGDATAGLLPEPAPDGALCLAEGVDDVLICFGVLGDTERLSDVAP